MLNRFVTSQSTTTGNLFYARKFGAQPNLRWKSSLRGAIIDCFGDRGRCLASIYKSGIVAIDVLSGKSIWDTNGQPLHYEASECVLTDAGYIFCYEWPKHRPIRTIVFDFESGQQCAFVKDGCVPVACCNDQLVLGHNNSEWMELSVSLDGKFTLSEFPFPNSGTYKIARQLRNMWIAQQPVRGVGDPVFTYAGDLETGTILWRSMDVTPYLADGDYVLAASDSSVHLISAADGATIWKVPTRIFTGACLIPDENKVIVHGTSISCFDLRNGNRLWHANINSTSAWGMIATIGIVWHADEFEVGKWRLYARDIHTGEVLWQSSPSRSRLVVRAIVDDCLLVSRGRTLLCYEMIHEE